MINPIVIIERYFFKIKRVVDFIPIIWNGFDFDYHYSLELFKKQLERQAKFFESGKSYSSRAKQDASRIRTAIQLMDKVYEDEYEMEWMDKIKERFGDDVLDWESEDTGRGDGSSYLKYKYEKWNNVEEIKVVKMTLVKISGEKQKKAEELLWKFIGHNIKHWWD